MTKFASILVAAAALSVALPAIAQQAQATAPRTDRSSIPTGIEIRGAYESFLDSSTGQNLPAQSLERVDLANRLSTLIELGRCNEARAAANAAGEVQMALRVRQLCRTDRTG